MHGKRGHPAAFCSIVVIKFEFLACVSQKSVFNISKLEKSGVNP
jgi:hypothetical protein